MADTITLVGLSGTGKSTAGALLASLLGQRFVDLDAAIEAAVGSSIADIFAQDGEAAFRRLESEALAVALAGSPAVIATGAGILEMEANESLLRQTTVIWLTAKIDTLVARLANHHDRPLLRSDPRAALHAQAARRTPRFASVADWIIATDRLDAAQTATEVQRYVARNSTRNTGEIVVHTPGGEYEVVFAPDALTQLPARLAEIGGCSRVWVVSDDHVWKHHGHKIMSILRAAAIDAHYKVIPPGEASKNLSVVASVYDWLLEGKVERDDTVLAFGGGVVGDLAGFVAATVLRGINLIQLPTTILAMVDSSIGGKTGVNHAVGKNLIGSFYQPRLVLADTNLLQTLPPRERQAGWAEAIKHGVIADAALFRDMARRADALRALQEPLVSEILRRAATVKVRVVSGDEREAGARILLNYGHTIGHALEQRSNYTMLHGEGVAVGMCVAASIARRLCLFQADAERQQESVLRSFELPVTLPASTEIPRLLETALNDKKVRGKRVRWVLPTSIGSAMVRPDVPDEVVVQALEELRQG